jgi:hypothetical protein
VLEFVEAAGPSHVERAEKKCVENAEDHCVGANGERQRENSGDGESRRTAQLAEGESYVGPD